MVEDEAGAREALVTLLQMLSYDVTAVESGERARLLPPEARYHLLLTDLVLPGMTGPVLAAELRQRWPDLEVVVMSGYTEEEAARHAVSGERHGFLQKPFDVAMLAAAIRSALDGGGGA